MTQSHGAFSGNVCNALYMVKHDSKVITTYWVAGSGKKVSELISRGVYSNRMMPKLLETSHLRRQTERLQNCP